MFKRTISGLALSIGFYAASAVAQIPPEVESLIEAREAAIRLVESSPTEQLRLVVSPEMN